MQPTCACGRPQRALVHAELMSELIEDKGSVFRACAVTATWARWSRCGGTDRKVTSGVLDRYSRIRALSRESEWKVITDRPAVRIYARFCASRRRARGRVSSDETAANERPSGDAEHPLAPWFPDARDFLSQ